MDLVAPCAAWCGIGPDHRSRLIVGQVVWLDLVGVVNAPHHHRLIRITLEKTDEYFLADAGQKHDPPPLAGPVLRHTNPARAVFVARAESIPVELDFDASVLVDVDLLARDTGDDCSLQALNDRLRRHPTGSEPHRQRDA